jgi:hypothetical protein
MHDRSLFKRNNCLTKETAMGNAADTLKGPPSWHEFALLSSQPQKSGNKSVSEQPNSKSTVFEFLKVGVAEETASVV